MWTYASTKGCGQIPGPRSSTTSTCWILPATSGGAARLSACVTFMTARVPYNAPSRMTNTRPRVLFISYNALIEPLGPTQILPYVCGLADTVEMSVLSFEKRVRSAADDARDTERIERQLAARGIRWIRLRYHHRLSLPATLFDIAHGVMRVLREHRRRPFDLLHARGYVPAAIAWAVRKRTSVPSLFDIRGLQAEEYGDSGHWDPRGLKFRLTKRVEQAILHDADGIVTLTNDIRPAIERFDGLKTRAT